MKNLLTLIFVLALMGIGVYFLWFKVKPEPSMKELIAQEKARMEKENASKAGENPAPEVDKEEVEILVDEHGFYLKRLYGKEINRLITTNPVKNVEVYNGVLTYQEQENGHWNFKAIHLEAYIDEYLKEQ